MASEKISEEVAFRAWKILTECYARDVYGLDISVRVTKKEEKKSE